MITITTRARDELEEILASAPSPGSAVRVEVVRGPHGCVHGWRLGIDETERAEDLVVRDGDLRLLVDPGIGSLLEGALLDYREDASAIGFVIDAPGAGHDHERGHCSHSGSE
jgi:Fe-S cluster assembly iron-binding protein IscA